MSSANNIAPSIRSALSEVRWRIRAYVLAEGVALAAVWIGLTFWIGLALDYLPVLMWASEIPRPVRLGALVVVALVLAWILYHWVLRRVFARLRDQSMAILVERRFAGFSDGLVTSVELGASEQPDDTYDEDMLRQTATTAEQKVSRLRLAGMFNPTPLVNKSLLALALLVPIGGLYFFQPQVTKIWMQRFYMLKDVSWPRDTLVEMVGFQVQRSAAMRQGQQGQPPVRQFDERRMKLAKGASGMLQVRAKSRSGKEPPKYCTVYYRSADGVRSSVKMNKIGGLGEDGFQTYSLASKPFKGVLDNLQFDVVAADRRLRDYELNVVDSPAVVGSQLHCEFPDYLVDEATSSWQPRDMEYVASGTSLPAGTRVTLTLTTNKPVQQVDCRLNEETATQDVLLRDERTIQYAFELQQTTTLYFALRDTDDVPSDKPAKFVIGAVKDEPPELKVRHLGIGAFVTADVRIPVEGTVKDDYRVDQAWFELDRQGQPPRKFPLKVNLEGELQGGLDFRDARGGDDPLELKVGDRIATTVKAADRFNLAGDANVGAGVRLQMEVVTPARLLAALDQRELAQRRIFEHVVEEMTATRDDLNRVLRDLKGEGPDDLELAPPEGEQDPTDEETNQRRAAALRLLRVQQSKVQSEKSTQETLAVGAAFAEIVLELRNNRVDSQDRQERINSRIAEPLELIGQTMFPELDRRLELLEDSLGSQQDDPAVASEAIAQVDDILAEMNKVLQEMLYIETYNELVQSVRLLLEEQQKLKTATKNESAKALKGLLD